MLTIFKRIITSRTISLSHSPAFTFTRRAKEKQLILHSTAQIDNMALRKKNKEIGKENPKNNWNSNASDKQPKFRVSLVGLPNCGKSSLFNCLIGERVAIVDKQYGMTRDRKQYNILDGQVSVIDTPGVEVDLIRKKHSASDLKEDIFRQTITALHESDLVLFVVDSKKSITADEIEFSKYLKTYGKETKTVLVCNKCDGLYDEGEIISEISKLGFDSHFYCSAEEGTGVMQLLNFIHESIPNEMKLQFEKRKLNRMHRFEDLVHKLKAEIESYNKDSQFKIKDWERDFRKINPNPELNEDLDQENYQDYVVKPEEGFAEQRGAQIKNIRMKSAIKICFIGKPNVGKSTLINQILGTDKTIVSEIPHTTRDSIRSKFEYKQRKIELIDTAGLNTPNIQKNKQEYLRKVQISTMLHVKESHVVVYVMDAFAAFKIEDFQLIQEVIKEGRPLVICVNKWEAVKQPYKYKAKNYLIQQLEKNLGQLHGNPLVFVSAKLSLNIDEMLDKIITTYDKWNMRISTGLLNNWLENFKKLDNLPKDQEQTLRINYLIQARVRPPLFIFFVNSKALFKNHYLRFLMRNMAKQFQMDGIPLRHTLRSTNRNENKKVVKPRKVSAMRGKMEDLKKRYGNFGMEG